MRKKNEKNQLKDDFFRPCPRAAIFSIDSRFLGKKTTISWKKSGAIFSLNLGVAKKPRFIRHRPIYHRCPINRDFFAAPKFKQKIAEKIAPDFFREIVFFPKKSPARTGPEKVVCKLVFFIFFSHFDSNIPLRGELRV